MKRERKNNLFVFSDDLELVKNFNELLNEKFKIISCSAASKIQSLLQTHNFNFLIIDLENEIEDILNILQDYKLKKKRCFIIIFYGFRFNKPQYEILIHSTADALFYKPVAIENVLSLIEDKIGRK